SYYTVSIIIPLNKVKSHHKITNFSLFQFSRQTEESLIFSETYLFQLPGRLIVKMIEQIISNPRIFTKVFSSHLCKNPLYLFFQPRRRHTARSLSKDNNL